MYWVQQSFQDEHFWKLELERGEPSGHGTGTAVFAIPISLN